MTVVTHVLYDAEIGSPESATSAIWASLGRDRIRATVRRICIAISDKCAVSFRISQIGISRYVALSQEKLIILAEWAIPAVRLKYWPRSKIEVLGCYFQS